jgi:hypothetical protein
MIVHLRRRTHGLVEGVLNNSCLRELLLLACNLIFGSVEFVLEASQFGGVKLDGLIVIPSGFGVMSKSLSLGSIGQNRWKNYRYLYEQSVRYPRILGPPSACGGGSASRRVVQGFDPLE